MRNGAEMLTADAAVTCSGRSSREIFRLIEAGLLHSVETDTGHVLICSVSLARFETINDTARQENWKRLRGEEVMKKAGMRSEFENGGFDDRVHLVVGPARYRHNQPSSPFREG